MGTPRQVFRQLPRAVAKFSTTSTMEIVESGRHLGHHPVHAAPRASSTPGWTAIYAQGLLTTVPDRVRPAPGRASQHDECESDGDAGLHLPPDLGPAQPAAAPHAATAGARTRSSLALRSQLRILQSAATDLVGSDDVDTVAAPHRRPRGRGRARPRLPARRRRPRRRRAARAQRRPAGRTRSRRWPPPCWPADDLGPQRRRRRRRLGPPLRTAGSPRSTRTGDGAMGDERSMLAAYAGHAAAALDLIIALDERPPGGRPGRCAARARARARRRHRRGGGHRRGQRGAAPHRRLQPAPASCCGTPPRACCSTHSSVGLTDEQAPTLLRTTDAAAPRTCPELVGMLTDREPRIISSATSSPALQAAAERRSGPSDVVAVPLLAGTTFLGRRHRRLGGGRGAAAAGRRRPRPAARCRRPGDHRAAEGPAARDRAAPGHARRADRAAQPHALPRPARGGARRRSGPARTSRVLFCDLDRFKQVNDTLGHAAGDELLRQVAARLRAAVRPGDTVGRLSGDEFAIILPGLVDAADADRPRRRGCIGCFAEPFRLEGTEVRVGTSVGVAVHDRGVPSAPPSSSSARPTRRCTATRSAATGRPSRLTRRARAPRLGAQSRSRARSAARSSAPNPCAVQPAAGAAEPLVEQGEHPVHGLRPRRVAGDVALLHVLGVGRRRGQLGHQRVDDLGGHGVVGDDLLVRHAGDRQRQRDHDAGAVLAGRAVHDRGAGGRGAARAAAPTTLSPAVAQVPEVGADGGRLGLVVLGRLPGQDRLHPARGQVAQRVVLLDGEDVGVVAALGDQAEVPVGDLGDVAQRAAALEQDLGASCAGRSPRAGRSRRPAARRRRH